MEITPEQFVKVAHCLPVQRGNVSLSNLQVVNAILYVAEHGDSRRSGCLLLASFIHGLTGGSPSDTQGRSRMLELGTFGSVRGVPGDGYPYRNPRSNAGPPCLNRLI